VRGLIIAALFRTRAPAQYPGAGFVCALELCRAKHRNANELRLDFRERGASLAACG
jgi:hypothetical protein